MFGDDMPVCGCIVSPWDKRDMQSLGFSMFWENWDVTGGIRAMLDRRYEALGWILPKDQF